MIALTLGGWHCDEDAEELNALASAEDKSTEQDNETDEKIRDADPEQDNRKS